MFLNDVVRRFPVVEDGSEQVEGIVQLTAHLCAEPDDDDQRHQPGDQGGDRAADRPG